jgi:glycosyltransferase domain-containing protein
MNLRSQITIITPTQNRPYHLTRLLDYYAETGFHLIVEDSGVAPLDHPLIRASHVDYTWEPNRSFTEKFYALLTKVQTPYVVFCSDDDFVVPEALDTCVQWLNNNHDYSTADGQRMRLVNKNGRNYYTPELRTEGYPGKHNSSDDRIERVKYQNAPHEGLVCAVMRTEYMCDMMRCCQEEYVKPDVSALILNIIVPAAGKTIILPILYSILSYIPGSSGTQSQYTLEFNNDIATEAQKQEIMLTMQYGAQALAEVGKVSLEEAHATVVSLLGQFGEQPLHPMLKYDDGNPIKYIAKAILPEAIYLLLSEFIKTRNLVPFLRKQPGNSFSNRETLKQLERVAAFVEKYNSYTSLRVAESEWYD